MAGVSKMKTLVGKKIFKNPFFIIEFGGKFGVAQNENSSKKTPQQNTTKSFYIIWIQKFSAKPSEGRPWPEFWVGAYWALETGTDWV